MKLINKYQSPSYNLRSKNSIIKYIIIHYTAMNTDFEAINYLCDKKNKVSSHYLIDKVGKIYSLVDIEFRAWHAGESFWKSNIDINSSSIGIEIVNSGHFLKFEKYTFLQIKSLEDLLFFLKKKYYIQNYNVLGHSDVAPYRKIDPGQKFPWKYLSNKGLVYFPKKITENSSLEIEIFFKKKGINVLNKKALYMLGKIGYNVSLSYKNKEKFEMLIKAYQMHFFQKNVSGKLDIITYELIKSYYIHLLTI